LRRLAERRVCSIIGEERTIQLIRVQPSGSHLKFHPINPPPFDSSKIKGSNLFYFINFKFSNVFFFFPIGFFGMPLQIATKQTGVEYDVGNRVFVTIPFLVEQCFTFLSTKGREGKRNH